MFLLLRAMKNMVLGKMGILRQVFQSLKNTLVLGTHLLVIREPSENDVLGLYIMLSCITSPSPLPGVQGAVVNDVI